MPGIRPLASAEIALIARELDGRLAGAYFKSFYELGVGAFLVTFSKDRKELAVFASIGRSVHLTEFREEKKEATRFASMVRRLLDGSRMEKAEQHGADRILVLSFAGKKNASIIFEMFGKGNVVVLNGEGIVELAYRNVSFSDRSVRKGALYKFPVQRGKTSVYADAEKALEHPKPVLYEKGGEPMDFAIEPVEKYEQDKEARAVRFDSLSTLLDSLYLGERGSEKDEKKMKKAEEIRKSIGKLKEQMKENEAEAADCRNAANAIFSNMNELNQLLERARKLKPKEARELEGINGIRVKRVDAKKKSVSVEL